MCRDNQDQSQKSVHQASYTEKCFASRNMKSESDPSEGEERDEFDKDESEQSDEESTNSLDSSHWHHAYADKYSVLIS